MIQKNLTKVLCLLLLFFLLGGCGRNDPEAALQATEKELIAALEARDVSRTLALFHPDFIGSAADYDRDWAKRTLLLLFTRHQKIGVVVFSSKRSIHPNAPERATSEGEIALIGADNILPDAANRYKVRLGWIMTDGKWKLLNLEWDGG